MNIVDRRPNPKGKSLNGNSGQAGNAGLID